MWSACDYKGKIRCQSTGCQWYDETKPRNCFDWNPNTICGFRDKPVGKKLTEVFEILEQKFDRKPDEADVLVRAEDYERILDEDCEKGQDKSAFDVQVGGSHYKDLAIQPTEYCQRNKLGACESNIVKYASRHGNKGGRIGGRKDVEKIIHYAELLLEIEYADV